MSCSLVGREKKRKTRCKACRRLTGAGEIDVGSDLDVVVWERPSSMGREERG